MKLGNLDSWNRRHPYRGKIDSEVISFLINNGIEVGTPMIDLPGPGYARSATQWAAISGGNYVAVERDNKVYERMAELHEQICYQEDNLEKPVLIHGDFWENLLEEETDGYYGYGIVKFCHTKTLFCLIRDERLLKNLKKISNTPNILDKKQFAFVLTICRRKYDYKKDLKRIENAVCSSKKWKLKKEKCFKYGDPSRGQGHMATIAFVFESHPNLS